MLEEDGVLRCCLYVLVPSAAKKRDRDAVSAGHGGMPGPSWWEVGPWEDGPGGAGAGPNAVLVLSRKSPCPHPLLQPPSCLRATGPGLGLWAAGSPCPQQGPEPPATAQWPRKGADPDSRTP